jgi:CMP-N-acetylneuraminic acid synthetase
MSANKVTKRYIAVVPVRAGSKGLPGKNLRCLDGVPLYLHAVAQGLRTVGRVLLSTDIPAIRQSDLPANVTLCVRPAELAADDTPMESVVAHLIEEHDLAGQTLVLLQATSPLRSDEDVLTAIALHAEGRHDLVMSVVARDSGVLKYGTLVGSDFSAMRDAAHCFSNRQSLPKVYGPNGAVYVFGADRFAAAEGFPTRCIGATEMPANRSIDIDTVDDFYSVDAKFIALRKMKK